MAKRNLSYYVEFEPGNHNYRSYIHTKMKHETRESFAAEHGFKLKVHGFSFDVDQVQAEPRKQSVWLEVVLFALITWGLLKYIPSHELSFARFAIGIALSVLLGLLVGILRIDLQKESATKFNNS
jgi:hypothetical protein